MGRLDRVPQIWEEKIRYLTDLAQILENKIRRQPLK